MLEFEGLNYWAILVAWLINIIVGSFWYSPVGFGKLWSKLSGVDMMKMPKDQANRAITVVAISALIQTIILAVVLQTVDTSTAGEAIVAGLTLWLGFTAMTTIGNTLYQRLSLGFWFLNASFFLVVMVVNSVILTVW